jgi:O-acetylhomoserine/O-acetylserine sulfhydrylase-like pyridoxal-dependent enzyme
MENLEKLVAGEESRLQGQRVALDLGEAEGAQLAARDAAAAKNAAITQGVTQLGQAGMGLYQSSELYGQKKQPNTTALTNTGVNIRNDTLNNLSEEALFNQIKPANQIFGTNDISAFSGGQTRVA